MTKTCFVISPIGETGSELRRQADQALKHLVKKALSDDFIVTRGDADENPGAITPRIIAAIEAADLVVADMSTLNANVFYELAIAHGFNIPTVHIQRVADKVPFDVKDMRTIKYDLNDPDELEIAQATLRKYAAFAVENPTKLETPLTSAGRFRAVETSTDPVAESNKQVLEAIEDLGAQVQQVLRGDRTIPTSTVLEEAKEDIRALRRIVDAVSDRGALTAEDLRNVITHNSSTAHDDYARKILQGIVSTKNRQELNRYLYTEELFQQVQARRQRGD